MCSSDLEAFEKPLGALSALYGDDPDIKAAILVWSKSSVAGIPTLATLRERFDGLAGKIVQASKTLEETGWTGPVAPDAAAE